MLVFGKKERLILVRISKIIKYTYNSVNILTQTHVVSSQSQIGHWSRAYPHTNRLKWGNKRRGRRRKTLCACRVPALCLCECITYLDNWNLLNDTTRKQIVKINAQQTS